MIDWSKLGPANSPGPSTPSTTAPVAPASPGSLPDIPQVQQPMQFGTGSQQPGEANMTQAQIDALDPGQQIGHAYDQLGDFLFGEKSILHNTFVPSLAGAVGGAIGAGVASGASGVTSLVGVASTVAGHIPLGGLPGGADDTFKQLGDWAKENDPAVYAQWQKVNAASQGDVLGGGGLRADFNTETMKYIDDKSYESSLGTDPTLAIGARGVGSVGQAFSHAVEGWLGLLSGKTQKFLGDAGAFNPEGGASFDQMLAKYKHPDAYTAVATPTDSALYAFKQMDAGKWSEQQARDYVQQAGGGLSRVQESAQRLDRGGDISDVERQAVEAYRSGAWSLDHANTYIESHGQGITRNPVGQILGSAVTDPLTYAAIGAGSIAKAGEVGLQIGEAGGEATTLGEKAGMAINAAQRARPLAALPDVSANLGKLADVVNTVKNGELGPAFRIARGLVDPLSVYKPSASERAVTDLFNGVAIKSFGRAYGAKAVQTLRRIAREAGLTPETDSAIASYSVNQGRLMVARTARDDLISEGLGEQMAHVPGWGVDDVTDPLAHNAGKDAETQLTDHMMMTAKNTFTAEEEAHLAGRLATTFGKDVPYWEKEMAGMSFEDKSILHATTFQMTEVEVQKALAMIDASAYKGDLPLRNMVLLSADTLDNVQAESIIAKLREVLKAPDDVIPEGQIDTATKEWNTLARRYPKMGGIGYATGGKEQLQALVDELEKKLQSGGITKRVTEDELSDSLLKPVKDVLDRHTMPPDAAMSPEEMTAASQTARRDAEASIARHGFTQVSNEKFFAAIKKASAVTKSNGRKIGETVYVYPKGEYATMRRFLTADGKTGFAIKPDGDLVSVFNGGDVRGAIKNIVPDLHGLGATKLDAFDESGRLPDLYASGGFKVTRREPWNPEYAPPGWKGDTPDVVYMEHPGASNAPEPLWKLGFRPDEEVAWGMKRNVVGEYVADADPTISHVIDAVPGRQPFSDTTRNVLGQIIGKSKAERLNGPVESIEAMLNTMRDGVTGQRLVQNISNRFERSMFDAGIPKSLTKEIFSKASDVAGLNQTTVRGLKPDNLWDAIHESIPNNLRLKDGSTLNIHIVMDHLLKAAEGDLRVMGVTSVLSQRMRNALRAMGDESNWAGQMTVTMYNRVRYAQPMFLIQRITDAPYFSILHGIAPVGKGALTGAKAELEKITENLGRTQLGRYFSMDMPEFATRLNFTKGIKSAMQQAGLKENKLQQIADAPNALIGHNMTNMLHANLGKIVRGVLDNLATAAEKGDPAFQADMLAAGEQFQRTFADWRRVYSENAGRVLDDNEVALQYIKDQLAGWRRNVMHEDGKLDFLGNIAEGERWQPASVGEIQSIRPDLLAQELGYSDATALRRDVMGHPEKVNGQFQLVKGEHDIPWLEEALRVKVGAHPDYIRRASAYFGEGWDDFWYRMSKGVDKGGLDISPHYAKEAQALIANLAHARNMDPWEYLSGVMQHNIGAQDIETHIGQLVSFLKAGKAKQPLEEWTKMFRASLDPSAQARLMDQFEKAVPIEDVLPNALKVGEFGKDAKGNAVMPNGFAVEPGYVYRTDVLDKMREGWRKGEGVTTDDGPLGQLRAQVAGRPREGVFRSKMEDSQLSAGRNSSAMQPGGKDRLTKGVVPPENIEVLGPDGQWKSLGADPMTRIMSKDFPDAIKERLLSGVPHPDPEIEGYMQALTKYVKDSGIQTELGGRTRADLRRLVEGIPTDHASYSNRSQALVISLLKNKITEAQSDAFRLAEMQTKRSVLERSLNHPLFGLYPASYMWGKVLPETVKFLARNPYAATYVIADVERAIAIQREYDRSMEEKMNSIDRSSAAFLLDYLTPGLPWSDHTARLSPMVRDLFAGKDPNTVWQDELKTVSPDRWIAQFRNAAGEVPGAVDSLGAPPVPKQVNDLQSITGGADVPGPIPTGTPQQITGPTKASALAPILLDDLSRLSSILLGGASPNQ